MKSLQRKSRALWLPGLAMILLSMPARGAVIIDDGPLNAGDVLIGPCGFAGATGPAGINDDFTNRSIDTGIANVAPGGVTTAPGTVVFRNTIQNTGGSDDLFVLSAPIKPAGFMIEISIDNGDNYITLETSNTNVTIPIAYHAAAIILVRINAPAGLKVLTGFETVIRATSTAMPAAANETIDRLYTGFIRLARSATLVNRSGRAALSSPGIEIEFAVSYANVSTGAGVGSSLLTAHNLVISENGNSPANNWGATTEHIVGASDTQGGLIIGDRVGSTSLTDIVTTLEAGQSGVFKFRRKVK
jgi:hypothetical protein